jgi:hypothetical protein
MITFYTTRRIRHIVYDTYQRIPMEGRPRTSSRLSLLLGGGSWILTLLYFIGQAVAQAAWRTPYSLIDNRVSDLGNTACGRTLANTYLCCDPQQESADK